MVVLGSTNKSQTVVIKECMYFLMFSLILLGGQDIISFLLFQCSYLFCYRSATSSVFPFFADFIATQFQNRISLVAQITKNPEGTK